MNLSRHVRMLSLVLGLASAGAGIHLGLLQASAPPAFDRAALARAIAGDPAAEIRMAAAEPVRGEGASTPVSPRGMEKRLTSGGANASAGALPEAGAAPARRAAGEPVIGLGSHHLDDRSIGALRDLGIRHVRTTLYPSLWRDNPTWRRDFDQGVDRAVAAGMELLVVVHEPSDRVMTDRERREAAVWFADFMGDVARRYRGRVAVWQLWNEMDAGFTDAFGTIAGLPMEARARLYADQLRLAVPAIRGSDPAAIIATSGIATDPDAGFLEALLTQRPPFDVLAVHTYGFPLWNVFEAKGRKARAMLQRHGMGDREVWNTEYGLEAKQVPWVPAASGVDRLQRETWARALDGNRTDRIYERTYGYQLWTEEDTGHGIFRRDWSPRPAAEALRARVR